MRGTRHFVPVEAFLAVFATVFATILPSYAHADDVSNAGSARLVNVESATTTLKGSVSVGADVRFFDHPEEITYASAELRYGFMSNLELGIRGTAGGTRAFTTSSGPTVFHGGHDAELFGKYHVGTFGPVNVSALGGISFPNTPAQGSSAGTVSGIAAMRFGERITGYLNPRAVFVSGNSIVGIGVGGSVRVADNLHLVGDWTGIVSGDNTRSTADGSRIRRDVWGVALRFSHPSESYSVDVDLGWGNATGPTTGFSLTPGLGDASGLYVALRAHR